MVVNNWVIVMEGCVAVTSEWSRLFFISFYFFCVMCVMNVLVAFFLDAYTKALENVKKQRSGEKREGGIVSKIKEAADRIDCDISGYKFSLPMREHKRIAMFIAGSDED